MNTAHVNTSLKAAVIMQGKQSFKFRLNALLTLKGRTLINTATLAKINRNIAPQAILSFGAVSHDNAYGLTTCCPYVDKFWPISQAKKVA